MPGKVPFPTSCKKRYKKELEVHYILSTQMNSEDTIYLFFILYRQRIDY